MKHFILSFLNLLMVTLGAPFPIFAMQNHPIIKLEDAVEASEDTKAYYKNVFDEYGLDSKKAKILAYYDPLRNEGADANDKTNTIRINSAFQTGFNPENPKDWETIFTAYHEVGHIKDRAMLKRAIESASAYAATSLATFGIISVSAYYCEKLFRSKYPNSFLFKPSPLYKSSWGALGYVFFSVPTSIYAAFHARIFTHNKAHYASEITADTLACQQLLKKTWGLGPIFAALAAHKSFALEDSKTWGSGHNHVAEYDNIVKILKQNGYEVRCNIVKFGTIRLGIFKDGKYLKHLKSYEIKI